ncbi:hypothetical protein [Ferrovum sp.]|uniref:hypothetical protein n=1 Tax=Ferrovum sp. TaxID=2609467 RepID=UPI00260FDD0C|nr:hypothetical protein [Ferrovum sp.]
MKKYLMIMVACVLMGCSTIKTPSDVVNSINVESGSSGCMGCNNIKTYTSGIIANSFYKEKITEGASGIFAYTGRYIHVLARLGMTNQGIATDAEVRLRTLQDDIGSFGSSGIQADPRGDLYSDVGHDNEKHHYFYFVKVNFSGNAPSQTYLVYNNNYISLAPVYFNNDFASDNPSNSACFSSGCVYDVTLLIPASLVKNSIANNSPIILFFGQIARKQVASKDGLTQSFAYFHDGAYIQIQPDYLKAFVDHVGHYQ